MTRPSVTLTPSVVARTTTLSPVPSGTRDADAVGPRRQVRERECAVIARHGGERGAGDDVGRPDGQLVAGRHADGDGSGESAGRQPEVAVADNRAAIDDGEGSCVLDPSGPRRVGGDVGAVAARRCSDRDAVRPDGEFEQILALRIGRGRGRGRRPRAAARRPRRPARAARSAT